GDGRIVRLHRLLEGRQRRMGRSRDDENLGRGAPDHLYTVALVLRLEVADVLPQGLGQLLLVLAALYVLALEPLHIVLVEEGRHRLDALEEVLDRLHMLMLVEHAAMEA